ncbi:MAG: choline TMA-lyase-activating enzyme [Clostridiales Family XIII bacterium]|jgi:pyruvate formate lyase activating enzyme|nr:choline TMA-lyase-activating enzyme [Clostridiales Family XIII bacterium]
MRNDGMDTLERKALIFNVQKYNMYDGPGVRTIIFFKGCPLHCLWCSNPEGQPGGHQVIFKRGSCIHCGACVPVCPKGIHRISAAGEHVIDREISCIGCRACEEICLTNALSIAGTYMSVSDLVDIVMEDKAFYDYSGGGVTLGGGEVLMQPEAAISLLAACKRQGVNTAIETSGYANMETVMRFAEYVDCFLYDVKHFDPEEHLKYTGVRNERILENLAALLERRYAVKVRIPLLCGINDGERSIDGICGFLRPYADYKNFKGVDLLPYHKLGVNKYSQLDIKYPLSGDPVPDDAVLTRVKAMFNNRGLDAAVMRH